MCDVLRGRLVTPKLTQDWQVVAEVPFMISSPRDLSSRTPNRYASGPYVTFSQGRGARAWLRLEEKWPCDPAA